MAGAVDVSKIIATRVRVGVSDSLPATGSNGAYEAVVCAHFAPEPGVA